MTVLSGGTFTAATGSVVDLFNATVALPDGMTLSNVSLSGSGNQLTASGTFTLLSGSTFTAAAGSSVNLSAANINFPTTVVLTTGSQTLTGKTLVSPIISGITSAAATNLTLDAGSGGANITLNQGANGNVVLAPNGSGVVAISPTSARGFSLSSRTQITGFPAIAFRAAANNTVTAFDVMPNGSALENPGNGWSWIDVCDSDCLTTNGAIKTARVGFTSAGAEFGSRGFNGAATPAVFLTVNGTTVQKLTTGLNVLIGGTNELSGSGGLFVANSVIQGVNAGAPELGSGFKSANNGRSMMQLDSYDGNAISSTFLMMRRARGTSSAPSATQAGDSLFALSVRGYGTSSFGQSAVSITATAAENFTNSAQGAYFSFNTTPTGSTVATEVIRLTAAGNLLVGGTTDISGAGGLKVFGSTASTSTTSGAFQVAGGAGIGGALYIGGTLSATGALTVGGTGTLNGKLRLANDYGSVNEVGFYNSANSVQYGTIGIASANGALSSNSVAQDLVVRSQAALRLTAGGATDRLVISGTDGSVAISATTDSTSTASGALVVAGGLAVQKRTNLGDELKVFGTTASTSTTSGALQVAGGAGIAGALNVGGGLAVGGTGTLNGKLRLANNYGSVNEVGFYDSANSVQYGTIGIASANGALSSNSTAQDLVVRSQAGLRLTAGGGTDRLVISGTDGSVAISATTDSTSTASGALVVAGGLAVQKRTNLGDELKVFGTTASTSTTSGALQVAGGAGIAGSVNVGGTLGTTGALTVGSTGTFKGKLRIATDYAGTNELGFYNSANSAQYGTIGIASANGALSSNSTAPDLVVRSQAGLRLTAGGATDRLVINSTDGAVSLSSTTGSTSTTTGALVVSGGVAIQKKTNLGDDLLLTPTADTAATVRLSGTAVSGTPGVWFRDGSIPAAANVALAGTSTATIVNGPTSGSVSIRVANTPYLTVSATTATIQGIPLTVTATTASISPTTGSATFGGGIGVNGRTSTKTLSVGGGSAVTQILTAISTLNFPAIPANGGIQDLQVSVPGAAIGSSVEIVEAGGAFVAPGVLLHAIVSAANTVTVRATNATLAAIDPASTVFRITVLAF